MRFLYILTTLWMIFCVGDIAYAKNNVHGRHHKKKSHVVYQRVGSPGIYGAAQLNSTLNYLIGVSRSDADIGVYVKSMKYGDTLFSRGASQQMTPASTMKIFTAEAALLYLGPEYRFATQLLTDAKAVRDG